MSYARITIKKGASFDLHMHPNVELIYVLEGADTKFASTPRLRRG